MLLCTGAYDWAKKTLQEHSKDSRQYLYTKEQLENGKTHDPLWNAAQVTKNSFTLHFNSSTFFGCFIIPVKPVNVAGLL